MEKQVYCKIINNIEGKSQVELAQDIFISKHTMHTHIRNIFEKTETSTQIELIIKHYREKLWKQYQQEK
jgi:DNA-binding CsgD family transcriptional regulator